MCVCVCLHMPPFSDQQPSACPGGLQPECDFCVKRLSPGVAMEHHVAEQACNDIGHEVSLFSRTDTKPYSAFQAYLARTTPGNFFVIATY